MQYSNGFVSSTSRAKHIASDDPLVLQISNLRDYISQARGAGKLDDAKVLEDNLRDLQEEYQHQRKQAEENYEDYKDILGKKEKLLAYSPSNSTNDENSFDENNPFFVGPDDEMQEIQQALKSEDNFSSKFEDVGELDGTNLFKGVEENRIADGSIDFDEYDRSGKNPFF